MIDLLRFLLARTRGDEAALTAYSAPANVLLDDLKGADVALIGNARSLVESTHGAAIDAAGLVIRINGAPMPSPRSHGTRTDWLAISTPVDAATLAARNPSRVIWMTDKRKRLPYALTRDRRFVLAPAKWNGDLATRLGRRPTTGLMLVDLISRSEVARYTLYGFDFFQSLSLSGRRTAQDVPHDFNAEQAFVQALAQRDGRLVMAGKD